MSSVSTAIYPNVMDMTIPTLVGLVNSGTYIIGASSAPQGTGTLTQLGALPTSANIGVNLIQGLNPTYFVVPAGADSLTVAISAGGTALTGAAGLSFSLISLFWPFPPSTFPSASIGNAGVTLAAGSAIAIGFELHGFSTATGGGYISPASGALPCRAWCLTTTATTWPSSNGTGLYIQAFYT